MNANWPKWIFISIAKHFDSALSSSTTLWIEGQHMDITNQHTERIELRIDGPFGVQLSQKDWHLFVEVNLLITVVMNDSNIYRKHELAGLVAAACSTIEIQTWGEDEVTTIGCLRTKVHPEGVKKDWLEIAHFGQIEQQTKIQQVSVEVHYETELVNDS